MRQSEYRQFGNTIICLRFLALIFVFFFSVQFLGDLWAKGNVLLDFKPASLKKVSKPNNSEWNSWLKKYVRGDGHVKYKQGKKEISKVKKYAEYLLSIDEKSLKGRSERLAYHLNLYNSIVVYGVLKNYPLKSVMKIPGVSFFKLKFFYKGKKISIDALEKKIILPKFGEPLVHFALNCASYSCPLLKNKAYTSGGLKSQLVRQTKKYLKKPEFARVNQKKKELHIIELFKWYKKDLGDPKKFYQKYGPKKTDLSAFKIKFIPYDWSLNGR